MARACDDLVCAGYGQICLLTGILCPYDEKRCERKCSDMPSFHDVILTRTLKPWLLARGEEEMDRHVMVFHLHHDRRKITWPMKTGLRGNCSKYNVFLWWKRADNLKMTVHAVTGIVRSQNEIKCWLSRRTWKEKKITVTRTVTDTDVEANLLETF